MWLHLWCHHWTGSGGGLVAELGGTGSVKFHQSAALMCVRSSSMSLLYLCVSARGRRWAERRSQRARAAVWLRRCDEGRSTRSWLAVSSHGRRRPRSVSVTSARTALSLFLLFSLFFYVFLDQVWIISSILWGRRSDSLHSPSAVEKLDQQCFFFDSFPSFHSEPLFTNSQSAVRRRRMM